MTIDVVNVGDRWCCVGELRVGQTILANTEVRQAQIMTKYL